MLFELPTLAIGASDRGALPWFVNQDPGIQRGVIFGSAACCPRTKAPASLCLPD